MPVAKPTFVAGAVSRPSFAPGTASRPIFVSGGASGPTFDAGTVRGPTFVAGGVRKPFLDTVSPVTFSVATGDFELLVIGSIFKIQPGSHVYLGSTLSDVPKEIQIAMPACTVVEMLVNLGVADLGSGTARLILRKQNVQTALDLTLSGTTTVDSITGSVVFADKQLLDVEVITSAACPALYVTVTPKIQFPS